MVVKVLIAKRLSFKKATVIPNGFISKTFGTICNVLVDTVEDIDLLLRFPDSDGLVYVKLKRKLEYRGHVLFEFFRLVFLDRLW